MAASAIPRHSHTRFDGAAFLPASARGRIDRRKHGPAFRKDTGPLGLLAARFPVVRRLVGDDSFDAVARGYIVSEPPGPALLSQYGDTFPRFLRDRGDAACVQYVADIAELEMVRGKAARAGTVRPVDPRSLSSLCLDRLAGLRLALHPSVFLVASRFPIVTIWESNRSARANGMIPRWRAESGLVARPFFEVEVRRLGAGGHAFVRRLSQGETVSVAAEAGMVAAPDFDIASGLAVLIQANIVVDSRQHA